MSEPNASGPPEWLREVDVRWDAARTERALAAMHRARRRRRAARSAVVLLSIAALAVLARNVVPAPAPTAPTPGPPIAEPAPVAPTPAQPPSHDRTLRLADGSTLTPLAGTVLGVPEHGAGGFRAVLDEGVVVVELAASPGPIVIVVGDATVHPLEGTLRVERDGRRARVRTGEGRARIVWPDGEAELGARREEVYPPTPSATPRLRTQRGAVAAAAWRELAERGEFDAAYDELNRLDASEVRDHVDELLLAADTARLSGHAAEALPWLARIERDHASDPRAALAAFTAGRVLAQLERHPEAARRFERAAELEPSGSLAGDALARGAESWARSGDAARARGLARSYLAEHAGGRWDARMRVLLGDEAP